MNYRSQNVKFHQKLNGKIEIKTKLNLRIKKQFELAYTPGVSQIVREIIKDKKKIFSFTIKSHSIAVISDGSAVLGLGNVGPDACLPVMEGKCAIFKTFANLNAWPICLRTQKTEEIVSVIKNISTVFGAINLEDIGSPRCFEIEKRLQNIGIPVLHDDQHATSIAVLAGLMNCLRLAGKTFAKCRIVIVGCGAAGTAIAKLLLYQKANDIIMVDRDGILSSFRKRLDTHKTELVRITNKRNIKGFLPEAVAKADILIGVSAKNIFTRNMIAEMNTKPIVFALANPDPEMSFQMAKKWKVKLFATGRSDYPNQINNALVFPGLFHGLLRWRKSKLTNQMKVKAATAISSLVTNPRNSKFIPSIFDKRVVPAVSDSMR